MEDRFKEIAQECVRQLGNKEKHSYTKYQLEDIILFSMTLGYDIKTRIQGLQNRLKNEDEKE